MSRRGRRTGGSSRTQSNISGLRWIFVRDAYTGTEYELTGGDATNPSWSPDGSKIAFQSRWDIWTINVDGSNPTNITNTPEVGEGHPDWSPDGTKLVYESESPWRLVIANPDGTGETALQDPVGLGMFGPVWSPDGTRIAFHSARDGDIDIYTIKTDGSDRQQITNNPATDWRPSWQPLPVNTPSTYVRPKARHAGSRRARPGLRHLHLTEPRARRAAVIRLLLAAQHLSPTLTVGVGDGRPAFSRSVGSVRINALRARGGADDADVRIRLSITNVMRKSDLSDYTGELGVDLSLQMTDREGAVAQTSMAVRRSRHRSLHRHDVDDRRRHLLLDTTVEALSPSAITEGARAIFELGPIRVRDGGDEDADTRRATACWRRRVALNPEND